MPRRRASAALCAILAVGLGACATTEGYDDFFAEGVPLKSWKDTQIECNQEAEFRDGQGTPWINWEKFDECAGNLGWARRRR